MFHAERDCPAGYYEVSEQKDQGRWGIAGVYYWESEEVDQGNQKTVLAEEQPRRVRPGQFPSRPVDPPDHPPHMFLDVMHKNPLQEQNLELAAADAAGPQSGVPAPSA